MPRAEAGGLAMLPDLVNMKNKGSLWQDDCPVDALEELPILWGLKEVGQSLELCPVTNTRQLLGLHMCWG